MQRALRAGGVLALGCATVIGASSAYAGTTARAGHTARSTTAARKHYYFGVTLSRSERAEEAKFGVTPAVVHQFTNGRPGRIGASPQTAVIYSFESMPTRAQFHRWLLSLNPHQHIWWAFRHEVDLRIKEHQTTLRTWKRQMAELIKWAEGRPNITATVILTGWEFTPQGQRHYYKPTAFWVRGLKALGGDMDGMNSSHGYPNFSQQVAGMRAAAAKLGHPELLVPEFGAPTTKSDPSTKGKAKWMLQWAKRFLSDGYRAVAWYDSNGETLNKHPEIHEWASIMSSL
jgi:hypothetical protein